MNIDKRHAGRRIRKQRRRNRELSAAFMRIAERNRVHADILNGTVES